MCRRVQGSQIFKQNWIISIRSRVIVILPIWVFSDLGGGAGGSGVFGVISYSLYEFRSKESSNRIKLSRLVKDLLTFLCFGLPAALGVGGWMDGGRGCPPHMCTCTCMHAHACTRVHVKHDNFMQMAAPLGQSLGIPYDVICTCACMHVCMRVYVCGGHPLTTPHLKNWINLDVIEIIQFCLKIYDL